MTMDAQIDLRRMQREGREEFFRAIRNELASLRNTEAFQERLAARKQKAPDRLEQSEAKQNRTH